MLQFDVAMFYLDFGFDDPHLDSLTVAVSLLNIIPCVCVTHCLVYDGTARL